MAYNIWYNLMLDVDFYCYTSDIQSGVIVKTISNPELIFFLEQIKSLDVVFDSELTQKIIELYGSMDAYK